MSSKQPTLMDQVAFEYQTNLTESKARIERVESKNALARVYKAVLEFPLEGNPKFKDEEENKLFITSVNTLISKNKMLAEVVREQSEKLKEAEDAFKEEEKLANGQEES